MKDITWDLKTHFKGKLENNVEYVVLSINTDTKVEYKLFNELDKAREVQADYLTSINFNRRLDYDPTVVGRVMFIEPKPRIVK